MLSDTLKNPDVLDAPSKHSVMHFQNWQALALAYTKQAKNFLVGSLFDDLKPSIEQLRTSFPAWQAWASDTNYDEKELKNFVKDYLATKGLVVWLHKRLVQLVEAAKGMHAEKVILEESSGSDRQLHTGRKSIK